jgi:hypothetical protein
MGATTSIPKTTWSGANVEFRDAVTVTVLETGCPNARDGSNVRKRSFRIARYWPNSAEYASVTYVNLNKMAAEPFSSAEQAVFRRLNTPEKIQRFLDHDVAYNKEPGGPTCRSPRRVLRDRTAHCMEGALLGAAALRVNGHPPLLLDLEAVRDDDHVLAVFRTRGHWGAVAKSNYSGLRYREPVYRTVRELVMSYFEHYYNLKKEKTLRRYSRPVNLTRFDALGWMTAEDDVWPIPDHLCTIPHTPVLQARMTSGLGRVDERLFAAGLLGHTAG